jgi:hypothetical protein
MSELARTNLEADRFLGNRALATRPADRAFGCSAIDLRRAAWIFAGAARAATHPSCAQSVAG